MAKLPSAGAPIKAEEAHSYIRKHLDLKKSLKENVMNTSTTAIPADVQAHFSDESNAFLFDVSQIKRLLETKDKNGELPEYLMVSLGAHYQEGSEKLNKPTVVLAGVKYNEEKDNYYSMSLVDPGTQHSPPLPITGFPAPLP